MDKPNTSEGHPRIATETLHTPLGSAGPEWAIGDVIEDLYEVKGLVKGTWGLVYFLHHRNWNTMLAMKTSDSSGGKAPEAGARCIREAESWIEVGLHPNIVSCHYVRTINGVPRIFMEYVEDGDLRSWMERGKLPDLKTILDVAIQISDGMQHAHRKDLIHRDLKPENIMMTKDGTAKVTDFGLAASVAEPPDDRAGSDISASCRSVWATQVGVVMGTPSYMAPEQWMGLRLAGKPADIYAFGCILYELLCGRPVFEPEGETDAERLESLRRQHLEERPAKLENAGIAIPVEIIECVTRCLDKSPSRRPQSFAAIGTGMRRGCHLITGEDRPREKPEEVHLLADGLNNKALSLLDLGRQDEAVALLDRAVSVNPSHLIAVYNRSLLRWRMAKVTDEEAIDAVRSMNGDSVDAELRRVLLAELNLERLDVEAAVSLLAAEGRAYTARRVVLRRLAALRTNGPGRIVGWLQGHTANVSALAASSNGLKLVSGGWDKTVRLWDIESGVPLRVFTTREAVSSVAVSQDGRRIGAGLIDGTLLVFDADGPDVGRSITAHSMAVRGLGMTSDGRLALSGSEENVDIEEDERGLPKLRLWDLDSCRCLRDFNLSDMALRGVYTVWLSHDGRWAATGTGDMDGVFRHAVAVWDVSTGIRVRQFNGHTSTVYGVQLGSDGRQLVSGSMDTTARLWDVVQGRGTLLFEGNLGCICSVARAQEGRALVCGGVRLRLWDVTSGRCVRTFDTGRAWSIAVCPESCGNWMAATCGHAISVWRLPSLPLPQQAPFELCQPSPTDRISADRMRCRVLLGESSALLDRGEVGGALALAREARALPEMGRQPECQKVWAQLAQVTRHARLQDSYVQKLSGHVECVLSVWVSPDGKCAISGSAGMFHDSPTILVWDTITGYSRGFAETSWVHSVASAFGCRRMVSACAHTIKLWDVTSGTCVHELGGQSARVNTVWTDVAFRGLLAGGADGSLRAWDLKTRECVLCLDQAGCEIRALSATADGGWAVTANSDGALRYWNVRKGMLVRTVPACRGALNAVCLSADRRRLVSGGQDGLIRLWNAQTGSQLLEWSGHEGDVRAVGISTDGRWVFSAGEDGTLRLWDGVEGKAVTVLARVQCQLTALAVSSDCRLVVVGGGHRNSIDRHAFLGLAHLEWGLEAMDFADWHPAAEPLLESFLTKRCLECKLVSGRPDWSSAEFGELMDNLRRCGYGWLRPAGVRRKLEEMAATWNGLPPLLGDAASP